MPETDFTQWSRENLERIAREAVDENKQLREDNKVLLTAWRDLIKRTDQAEALAGSPARR